MERYVSKYFPLFMRGRISLSNATLVAMLATGTLSLISGCATKKYVRTRVDDSAHNLSARMDKDEEGINTNIKANSGQIEELNGVTRDHSQKISTFDNGLKQTDGKAQQALTTGQTAQTTASKAVDQVSSLDNKFQNRNHYVVLKEEQVRFKFNSAKLEKSFKTDTLVRIPFLFTEYHFGSGSINSAGEARIGERLQKYR